MVRELGASGEEPSGPGEARGTEGSGGCGGVGGTARRTRQANAVAPPVNYAERDSSIDTILMVEHGPPAFRQAMDTKEAAEWKEAIDSEAASLEENGTFEEVNILPPDKKAIPPR